MTTYAQIAEFISYEELQHALEVGKEAAITAAKLIQECYRVRYTAKATAAAAVSARAETEEATFEEKLLDIEVKSGETDLVTKYDKECEDAIIAILSQSTPSYTIISEERNPSVRLPNTPSWIIDPIDGTMDFVHGQLDCCVSIGLAVGRKPVLGIVHCPFVGPAGEGELVYGGAAVGGVWLNGLKVQQLQPVTSMNKAIVCLNMPWRATAAAVEAASNIRRDLLLKHSVRGIRMYGAAVFQEVQVALGRIDGYSEPGGKIWDVAAGAALIEAVGGVVRSIEGGPFELEDHTITCGASAEVTNALGELCKTYEFRKKYWA